MELKLHKNYHKRLKKFIEHFGVEPTQEEMKDALYQNEVVGNGGNTIGREWISSKGLTHNAKGTELNGWHDTYAGDTLVDLGRMLVEAEEEYIKSLKAKFDEVCKEQKKLGGKLSDYYIPKIEKFHKAKDIGSLEGLLDEIPEDCYAKFSVYQALRDLKSTEEDEMISVVKEYNQTEKKATALFVKMREHYTTKVEELHADGLKVDYENVAEIKRIRDEIEKIAAMMPEDSLFQTWVYQKLADIG